MKILLVDDHALFLDGLCNLLTLHGIQVVGTARDGMEAFEKTILLQPDMVLMDIRMPVCDGVTATKLIKSERPEVKIVMLTTSDDEPDLLEAIRSGASGYLLKSLETGPFLSYLEAVDRGEAAISRELSATLMNAVALQNNSIPIRNEPEKGFRGEKELTPRQLEILLLVTQGFTNKEMAARLSVSEHTIKYHLGEIFHRLHLKNREQASQYAIKKGLVKRS
jgi:DNA-binding NarL/FixJ family response regulator